MLKKLLHIALFLCLALAARAQNPYLQENLQGGPPAPGPRTRSPLNSMSRAANNLPGATILTDTFGNQRLALFVHIEDTCINYTPASTGNTANLSAFVEKCSTDSIWYIDWEGKSIFLGTGGGGGACDEDWLNIVTNDCPGDINDSIYTYKYAAVGARLVWPTAEFLVNDSTNAVVQILSGNRNVRLGFWDNFNAVYSTIDQSGTSTIWYINPTGEFRITTAGGGTPQSPGAPFVNQFAIDPNDTPLPTVQAHQYPNTRVDTNTVRNFVYTDPLGKFRTQPLDSLIVIITDSIASDTALQYNWYTRDATTTEALRTATILQSAQWIGDDPAGYLLFQMGSLGGGRALVDTAAAIYHDGSGGRNIVQADAQGIDITTSSTASRAVNLTTDTLNVIGAFDPTEFLMELLCHSTITTTNGVNVIGIGDNEYWQADFYDAAELLRGNSFLSYTGGEMYAEDQNSGDLALLSFSISNSLVATTSGSAGSGNNQTSAFQAKYNTSTLAKYAILHREANDYFTSAYLGTNQDNEGLTFQSLLHGFGVQTSQPISGGDYSYYDWIRVVMEGGDTTINGIAFYDSSYLWVNAIPSPTVGDTSFHFWAGTGTDTDPGFITLDEIQAGAPNWYNSNGTTTDNTRIATVTETATWLSDDVQVDGVFPFRFELAGEAANEPEMMVWKFPTDSLTLAQSDQEIFFRSTNRLLMWANNDFIVTADSILLNGTQIGANGALKNGIVFTPFSNEIAQSGLGVFSGLQAAQSSSTVEFRQITGTAQSELFVNGSSERMILPFSGTAWNFSIRITAVCDVVGNGVGVSAGETWASWHCGGIKRNGTSTALVGTVQNIATAQSDTGMSTSVVTIDADDTNESLRIQFTPPSTAGSTTVIRVVATVELTEIQF